MSLQYPPDNTGEPGPHSPTVGDNASGPGKGDWPIRRPPAGSWRFPPIQEALLQGRADSPSSNMGHRVSRFLGVMKKADGAGNRPLRETLPRLFGNAER